MGLRITSMLTIEYAKKKYGADLSGTLTLGRQFRAFTRKEFRKYLPQYGNLPEAKLEKAFKSPYAEAVFEG